MNKRKILLVTMTVALTLLTIVSAGSVIQGSTIQADIAEKCGDIDTNTLCVLQTINQ